MASARAETAPYMDICPYMDIMWIYMETALMGSSSSVASNQSYDAATPLPKDFHCHFLARPALGGSACEFREPRVPSSCGQRSPKTTRWNTPGALKAGSGERGAGVPRGFFTTCKASAKWPRHSAYGVRPSSLCGRDSVHGSGNMDGRASFVIPERSSVLWHLRTSIAECNMDGNETMEGNWTTPLWACHHQLEKI